MKVIFIFNKLMTRTLLVTHLFIYLFIYIQEYSMIFKMGHK
jgi:hypothetical protein